MLRAIRKAMAVMMVATVVGATLVGVEARADAEEGGASTARSDRMSHRLGFGIGVSNPFPGLIGVNASYNLIDMVRLDLGYSNLSASGFGVESSVTTLGAGGNAFVPGWSLSPTAGLHYAQVIYSGTNGLKVSGFDQSGGHLYGSLGIDYQSKAGFNGGVGYHFSFKSGIGSSAYVQLGWFFDWLG